jgi:hypothetical protein
MGQSCCTTAPTPIRWPVTPAFAGVAVRSRRAGGQAGFVSRTMWVTQKRGGRRVVAGEPAGSLGEAFPVRRAPRTSIDRYRHGERQQRANSSACRAGREDLPPRPVRPVGRKKKTRRRRVPVAHLTRSSARDIRCLLALGALRHVEGNLLALFEGLEPAHGDRGEMSEKIFAAIVRSNEAETLASLNHFTVPVAILPLP